MAQKHLRELLQEDQEPFQLKHYIADRRCEIKRASPRIDFQVKKRKFVSKNQSFPSSFCFFSVHESPDPRKSPLFDPQSHIKSPSRVFLHVPARTAALLLEAAARIQKQSSKNAKNGTRNRGSGFGLFGSVLKRLTHRGRTRKPEVSVSSVAEKIGVLKSDYGESAFETRVSCSCHGIGSSSRCGAVWFETHEDDDISLDSGHKRFCECSFRFALQTSPSSAGCRTPNFTSPPTSPSHRSTQDKDNYTDIDGLEKLKEDKEQCSPVSVLDPLFDEERAIENEHEEDDEDEDEDFDAECSYAIVQRTKRRLLQKLRRFEQLAGLDPVELEKRMPEQEQENYSEVSDETVSMSSDGESNIDKLVQRGITSNFCLQRESCCSDKGVVMRWIWRRLDSWKEVESKTVYTVMEQDFAREVDEWKRTGEQVEDTALEIELAIFGSLVEELSDDLVSFD